MSFKMAWYPPSHNTLHVSPMRVPLPVGYGNLGSLDTVETAVPEIAPSPSVQLAVQDFPEAVFGQSLIIVEGGTRVLMAHGANLRE